jgi:hypothetical protein
MNAVFAKPIPYYLVYSSRSADLNQSLAASHIARLASWLRDHRLLFDKHNACCDAASKNNRHAVARLPAPTDPHNA